MARGPIAVLRCSLHVTNARSPSSMSGDTRLGEQSGPSGFAPARPRHLGCQVSPRQTSAPQRAMAQWPGRWCGPHQSPSAPVKAPAANAAGTPSHDPSPQKLCRECQAGAPDCGPGRQRGAAAPLWRARPPLQRTACPLARQLVPCAAHGGSRRAVGMGARAAFLRACMRHTLRGLASGWAQSGCGRLRAPWVGWGHLARPDAHTASGRPWLPLRALAVPEGLTGAS
jgi:hypothetical protein